MLRVESIRQDLVEAKIAHECKTICGIQCYAMRVRSALALRIDALAGVLYETGSLAQPAVGTNRKNGNTSTPVVRHQKVSTLLIQD